MNRRLAQNQSGAMNLLLIPLVVAVLLLLGTLVFGVWAFSERQDYKNNSDVKAENAAALAVQQAKSEKDNEFLQREKEPFKSYTSPVAYGSFTLKYPKTWSAYADERSNSLTLTLQPDVVSSNTKTAYALKVEVTDTSYAQAVSQMQNDIKLGKLTATAVSLPKVPDVVGLRVDGQISNDKKGSVVYIPLRDKTLRIATEAPDKVADFNNIILPNFEFKP